MYQMNKFIIISIRQDINTEDDCQLQISMIEKKIKGGLTDGRQQWDRVIYRAGQRKNGRFDSFILWIRSLISRYIQFKNNMGNKICQGQSGANTNPHLLKGVDFYHQQKYQEAVDEYSICIQQDPKCIEAYSNRALAYKQMDNIPGAISDLDTIIELNPSDAEAYTNRGVAHQSQGNYEKAVSDFDSAISINKDPKAYVNRGNICKDRQNYQEAISDYTQGLNGDPRYVNAYEGRGYCYLKTNQHQKAIDDFNEFFKHNEGGKDSFMARGYAHFLMEHYNQSADDYSKVIAADSGNLEAYGYRGRAHYFQQRFTEAEPDLSQFLNNQPGHPIFQFYLANCHLHNNNGDRAIERFNSGIEYFQRQNNQSAMAKFSLTQQQFDYIDRELSTFNQRIVRLERIDTQSQMSRQKNISEQAQNLMTQVQVASIPRVANFQFKFDNNVDDLQTIDERINDLARRNEESMSKELRIIIAELKNIDKNVYSNTRVEELINTIQQAQKRQYYEQLYNFLINHFISYRVCYTVYQQKAQPFTEVLNVLEEVSYSQPIIQKLPFFGDMVKKPYQIIELFGQRLESLSKNISHKVGTSQLNKDEVINDFISYTVEELFKNQEFNDALNKGLNEQREIYLNKIWKEVAKDKEFNESEIFSQNEIEFTHAQKIVIAHVILVTKLLYEIDLKDFQKISVDKLGFYETVRKSLPPEQKTMSEQGMVDTNFKQMGGKDNVGCCQNGKCMIM